MKALQASSVPILAVQILNAQNALPSWNDTASKEAIVGFVERVTREGSPDLVPPAERIAESRDGQPMLLKEPEIEFIDDGPGKQIHRPSPHRRLR
jgi:hypothetical protein